MNLNFIYSPLLAGFLLLQADSPNRLTSIIPHETYSLYQTGDLIFRQGRSIESFMLLASKTTSEYTHVGLIVRKQNQLWVLHSAPAEINGEFDGVKMEPLSLFARKDRANKIAITRPFKKTSEGIAASKNALKYLGKPFDVNLDLQDDAFVYCTELVAKAYSPLNIDLYVGLKKVDLPFYQGSYLVPQDIYDKARLKKIAIY